MPKCRCAGYPINYKSSVGLGERNPTAVMGILGLIFCFYRFTIYKVTHNRLMTLTLSLPPELEQYLIQEAQQQGLSVETYVVQLLQKEKQLKTVNVLQSWIDESDEQ